MELKPIEVIMKLNPVAGLNAKNEICIKADKVSELIRCVECKWLQYNMKPDGTLPNGVDEYECRHWCGACYPTDYCSYGVRRNE